MIVATPTITHTGTRFLHRQIFHSPKLFMVTNPHIQPKYKDIIIHVHMFSKLKSKYNAMLIAGWPIVIPLTHPARNKESQRRQNRWPKEFKEQWLNMINFCTQCQPLFLHLDDKKIREQQAEKICEQFGLPKEIDWTPRKTTGAIHGTHELELTEKYLQRVPQYFIDFYEQAKEGI